MHCCAKYQNNKMQILFIFLLIIIFCSITNGYYLRMSKKLESKLDDNTALLQHIFSGLPKEIREVAYVKSSKQSSTHSVDYASMAVDANLNTYMHTNMDQSPYWIVDLGKLYEIKRIEIFNRKQGAISTGRRLHDLDITVGTSHNEMHICAHYVGLAQLGARLVFECQHYEKARFVKLMIRGREFLHVAEVKVFALDDMCG